MPIHTASAYHPKRQAAMFYLFRIVIVGIALAILAFCMFGFLATFEPPGSVAWRIAYIAIGLCCTAVATWALVSRRWRR